MAVLLINDNERRIEYTAAAAETIFVYPWEIFQDGDLDVYVNEVKLTLTTDYTVTNAGVTEGGDVILVVPSTLNDEVVIVGDLTIDQTTDFTIKANFTGTTIQVQMDKLTMIAQELDTKLNQRGLLYNVFTNLKPDNQDNILPQLTANQIWQMNSTGTGIFAAELEVDPGANTLRAELISNQSGSDGSKIVGYFSPTLGGTFVNNYLVRTESKTQGSDGASIIGYYDESDATEKTVKIKLDEIHTDSTFKNIIIGGDFTTNPFQRGTSFTPIANDGFPADRFKYNQVGGMVLKSSMETTSPPTVAQAGIFINKYVRLEVTTGASLGVNDLVLFRQMVEGYNWTRIAQRKFTVSFWVRSKITGTFSTSFVNGAGDRSFVSEFTIDTVDTWEKKILTVDASPAAGTWDYENDVGIRFGVCLGGGTNSQTTTLDAWQTGNFIASTSQTNFAATTTNTIDFATFQIEEGEKATRFEVRHFSDELAMCQRYFYKTYNQGVDPGSVTTQGNILMQTIGSSPDQFGSLLPIVLPVTIRVQPSLIIGEDIQTYDPGSGTAGVINNTSGGLNLAAGIEDVGLNLIYIKQATGSFPKATEFRMQATVDVEL